MRIVNTSNVKWHQNKLHIRAGAGLKIKQILKGQSGTQTLRTMISPQYVLIFVESKG